MVDGGTVEIDRTMFAANRSTKVEAPRYMSSRSLRPPCVTVQSSKTLLIFWARVVHCTTWEVFAGD